MILQQRKLSLRCEKPLRGGFKLNCARASSAHRSSPEGISRWSYPAKHDSKNDVSLTTYRHSADKHLEKSLARRVRDVFVKKNWRWRGIVTWRAASSNL